MPRSRPRSSRWATRCSSGRRTERSGESNSAADKETCGACTPRTAYASTNPPTDPSARGAGGDGNQPNEPGSEVRLFGSHFIPLDRTDNSAHAKRTGGALHHVVQQHGFGDHRPHGRHPAGHDAVDPEAAEADAGHERLATQAEGDPRPVFKGPGAGVPGNDAPVPGSGGEPLRLPGPHDCPDADPSRPVPRFDSDGIFASRRLGRTVGEVVLLDTGGADLPSGSIELEFPLAGPSPIRPHQPDHAGGGLRIHLGPAKDDHAASHGPEAGGQPGNDAMADAPHDCIFLIHIAQRTGPLLGDLQRHRYRYSIFRYGRMGTVVPIVPKGRARSRAGAGGPAVTSRATRGDGRRWKS